LDQLLRDYPDESRLYTIVANAAVETDRIPPEPAWWEERLASIEGLNGPLQCYLAAARELRKAEAAENEQQARDGLATADARIRDGLATQSRWGRGVALSARIRDQQLRWAAARRDAAAIQTLRQQTRQLYQQAFEFGDRAPLTVLRLSELTEDAEEAARILAQLGSETIVGLDPLLTQMVGLRMASGDLRSAEELAAEATKTRPNDIGAWLSLAAVYLRQQRIAEADEIVAKAEAIARDGAGTRDALGAIFQFQLLAARISGSSERRMELQQRARRLIEPIVAIESAENRVFTRGVLLDAIGDDEAAKWYLEYEQTPNPVPEQLEVILDFFSRRNVPGINSQEVAIRLADKLVQLRPTSVPYKSQLSQLLMERGRPEDWESASKLIASAEEFGPETVRGRRAQAAILWERREVPREARINNLNTVIGHLNAVTASNEVNPEDLILLASAYRELSDWTSADQDPERYVELRTLALEALARVAQFSRLEPNQLLLLGLGLIELESWEQAETTIGRLTTALESQRVPNPGPIALQIDIWRRRGEADIQQRGEPLLTGFLQELDRALPLLDDLQKGRIFVQVAAIWELLDQPAQALEWYRKAAGLNSELLVTLVYALVRDNQKKAALEVCQQAFQTSPNIQTIVLLSDILVTGRTTDEEFAAAEPLMDLARQQFGNDITVLGSLANIRSVQPGGTAAAIELYSAGLKLDPNQFVLLNNLATLYGEIPEKQIEALGLIDRAISIAGQIPALLNTKARILANQGRLAEARQLLQSIIRRDADSRYWWQLAEVELKLFDANGQASHKSASQTAWQEALKNGIETATLTPEEYQRMEAFRTQLTETAN
jgi:tetratricopeptide (TPR) repeat protein